MLDDIDRRIINGLQGSFPVTETPFADAAEALACDEAALIARIGAMLDDGRLSRFGPMFNVERMGGAFCLCAMAVPPAEFDAVAEIVNSFPEVAHNYERAHALNMWFVLAAETPERIGALLGEIAAATGYPVLDLPKIEEFYVGLRIEA